MNKAILLDRDGVIIRERGDYTFRPDDVFFNDDIVDALKIFRDKGFLLIIISNQGGIGKGLYSTGDASNIHKIIRQFFKSYQVTITDILFCPHHPSTSLCICRKPDSLLIEKALAMYHIDPEKSFFIGDSERDSEAALKAGIKAIKINPNDDLHLYLDQIQ